MSRKNTPTDRYYQEEYRGKYGPYLGRRSSSREIYETYLPFQQQIITQIKPYISGDSSVLDVGCSAGHFLTALKEEVGIRVGIELNPNDIAFIREFLDFTVYSSPIESAAIAEAPFDLITCLEVLEHIDNPLSFLEGVRKQLKDTGYFYIEIPNINDALITCYDVPEYSDFYYREPHVSYFSTETLRLLLTQAGFEGVFKTIQRYNFLNHLNWILTGKPQENFLMGNEDPVLVRGKLCAHNLKNTLNTFIRDVDARYKKILSENGCGETITFLGRKR